MDDPTPVQPGYARTRAHGLGAEAQCHDDGRVEPKSASHMARFRDWPLIRFNGTGGKRSARLGHLSHLAAARWHIQEGSRASIYIPVGKNELIGERPSPQVI